MKIHALSVAATLSVLTFTNVSACGDFVGLQHNTLVLGNGHVAFNLYAKFTSSSDRVLAVTSFNVYTPHPGGFHQSAANPTWTPGTQNINTSDDSWVCIGTNPINNQFTGPNTAGDANFLNFGPGATDYSFIDAASPGAGWYDVNPSAGWGLATQTGNRTLLARLVWPSPPVFNDYIEMTATIHYERAGAPGVVLTASVYHLISIPAPGAWAFLVLSSAICRRRIRSSYVPLASHDLLR